MAEDTVARLKTILRHMETLREAIPDERGLELGSVALADTVDWLDCYIDELERRPSSQPLMGDREKIIQAMRDHFDARPPNFDGEWEDGAGEAADAILASLPEQSGWRFDMENAPRDGTHFLAVDEAGDACRCAYHSEGYLSSFCGQPVVQPFEPIAWRPWEPVPEQEAV